MGPVPDVVATVGRDHEFERAVGALTRGDRGLVVRGPIASGASAFATCVASTLGPPVVLHADAATGQVSFATLLPLVSGNRTMVPNLHDVVSAADAIVEAAGPARAAVVVDDAQHLDDGSALGLALASASGVPLVLVVGDHATVPAPLVHLAQSFTEIRLHDLADSEVAQLAGDVLGGPVEPVLVRSLTRLVGSAVGAIVDVLGAAAADGSVKRVRGVWRQRSPLVLPDVTLHRVDVHLSTLSQPQREALDLLSIVSALPLAVVDAMVDADDLVALEAHGMIEVSPSASGDADAVAVREPVVRSARCQQLGRLRRRQLAQRIHDAIGATDAAVDDHVATSVLLESGGAPQGSAALAAARRCRLDGEIELALRLCLSARIESVGVDLPILRAEILASSGQGEEADVVLSSIEATTDEELALVVMTRAVVLSFHLDRVDEALHLLDDLIEQLDAGPWAAEAIGIRGVIDLLLDDPCRAIERAEPYLDPPSGRQYVEAATAVAPALVMLGQHDRAAALSRAAMHERLAMGDQTSLSSAGLHAMICGMALGELGSFAEAAELTDFVLDVALDVRDFDGIVWAGVIRGRALLHQGLFPEAIESFELAASAALDADLALQLRWARAGVLMAVAQLGDPVDTRRALNALDTCPPTQLDLMRSEVMRARGWAAVALRDLRQGEDHFRAAAARARLRGEAGLEILALHDLARIGDTSEVERMVEVGALVDGELAAALVAHAAALAATDVSGLLAACEHLERLGAVVVAAEAANQASWIERRRGHATSAERLRARSLELRSCRPQARTPALASHPGLSALTAREREVATFASAGESSKAIAQRLGVSVRTVDNLLQRVYRKLGANGRADLRSALLDDLDGG